MNQTTKSSSEVDMLRAQVKELAACLGAAVYMSQTGEKLANSTIERYSDLVRRAGHAEMLTPVGSGLMRVK